MNEYRFVDKDGMGVLEKKIRHDGQPDTWEEDMKSPLPTEPVDAEFVNQKIADTVNSINIADETNGDITVEYDDGEEEQNYNN